MGVVVAPNYAAFIARYPEFTSPAATPVSQPVNSDLYNVYFNEATLYQANNGAGPICDAGQAITLLNMLIAHIASLNAPTGTGQAATGVVGRVANATEGSVTIGTDNQYPAGSPQWYQQTKYGAAWWAATAGYRTMRYRVGPATKPAFGRGNGGFGGWGGGGRGF
jgi:hypothetical protein